MDELGILVKAAIQEGAYDLIVENRKYLEFANAVFDDGDHKIKALHALLVHAEKTGKCPENLESLIRFVLTNPYHVKEFSTSAEYDTQLTEILQDDTVVKESAESLIDEVYQKAHTIRISSIYAQAGSIAAGHIDNPHTKERGPAAAQEYITEELQRLVTRSPKEASGDLVENLDYIDEYIRSFIIGDSKRVYTGFKRIDDITLIGKKQRNKWIGILGYTHHAKSLFLMSMVYNMASLGANVMLVPRESSVEEAWMSIIWLHHSRVCPDKPIAKREDWMRIGAGVGSEKYNTIQAIIKDLREGTTLPGRIVVYPCNSWEDIEDKLRATNKKYKYDVLAIDYFAHLEPENSGRKNESDIDKHKKALRKAQMLSLNGIENDKSGLVIITPLQVNKKGYEEAAKREGDKYGIYESPTAVEWFTQAAQDMDLLMSVWYEGDRCTEADPKQIILHCLKGRMNMRFPTHTLKIHPDTGLISDLDAPEFGKSGGKTADSLSAAEIEDVMYTKVNVDADSWNM